MEEKINKLITDVAVIKASSIRIEEKFVDNGKNLYDHESRLRILEDFKSKFTGALLLGSFFGGLIGAIVGIIVNLIKG